MNSNDEGAKPVLGLSENENNLEDKLRIEIHNKLVKHLAFLFFIVSLVNLIRHLIFQKFIIIIICDLVHTILQFLLQVMIRKKKVKTLQNANFAIFLQTLIYMAYMICNYLVEKNIKQNVCTSSNYSQSKYSQLNDEQYQSQIFTAGFCDEQVNWYLVQGQIIYFYLYAQQNYIFSLLLIFINFLAGLLCYKEYLWTHIFLLATSLCMIYQKRVYLTQIKQQSALFEYIFQKYQFWLQFVFKYMQKNVFLAQLSSPSEHKLQQQNNKLSQQSQIDIQQYSGFSRYFMENNKALRKLKKKPSITYKCPQYSNNKKVLDFPFSNLKLQQQMPNFKNEYLSLFNCYLSKYALRSINQKDSIFFQNPCKSFQESRLSFKDQQRANGVQNLGNSANNDQNYNNNNNNLNNINSRLQTNQNIQHTSHIQTNQNEETIQFDSHPIHFSSYNQIANQNKNGSHQCIYLLQNSSMQHIQYESHHKSNLKNGNYNTNHTNPSYLNGKQTAQNSILKRNNLCQNNLNLNSNNNTDRKNSLLLQGYSSPQVLNPLFNELIGVKTVEQTKNKVIQDKNNCVNNVVSKKEVKSTESPLKCMEGESLMAILMKNLEELEQNEMQDKKQSAGFQSKFLDKQQSQSLTQESKLGDNQNIYIFQRTDSQIEDLSSSPQYIQVKFIECVYEGKCSYLIMMEELKKNISSPSIENKLLNSSSQEQKIKSDNLKIKTFKQKIISSLAHELKTPLNSIISQINQLLLNRNQESVNLKSKDIQILKSSANLLNYKIEDLLNYSMYMKGENKLNLEKFSILEIVNEMIEIFKPQAKLKNLYFHSKITLFQTSLKKSLELKNCKNSSPQIDAVIDQVEENLISSPLKSMENKVVQKYEFCPVEDFKKKFVSLKFMSEKVINTPISDIYSNTSEKLSQHQPQNEVREQQLRPSQCGSNNNEYNQYSSKNTVQSPLKQQDVYVRSDRKKLICILTNLLTNALKFTFKGGISFTVNQVDKYNFEFSVSDTGIGIEQKLVKRMNNVNIEDYDTIFMNDQEEESLNEQDISEELQEIKDSRNFNQNNSSIKQNIPYKQNQKRDQCQIKMDAFANKENNELEKKSRIEESTKKELKLSLFQQESQKIKLQQNQQKNENAKSVIEVKEACSINESLQNTSKDASPFQSDNKKSSPTAIKEDKNCCSIRLIENNDQMKKSNVSSFSLQNQKQQKNQHYKSQPSLYNFQRNCGIGVKIVKILTSQLSSNTQNLKIKSKENLGSTFTFTLEDQSRTKAAMSQFVLSDRNIKKKNFCTSEITSRQNQPNYTLTHPYKDEIILSDSSLESHEDIKSQYIAQKSNTNRSFNSIAEFVDYQKYDQNDGCYTPRQYNHENVRKCNYKKNKSDLDFLANQNLLNSNSLKLQTLLSNKRILLVDDMPFNIQILKNYLKGVENLEIKEAFNGMSAIEQVQQENFDLILMDINMPLMDGIEATFKITELIKSNQIQPVPIIIVSAYTATQDIQNSLKSGAAGHVSKPISIKSLISEINKVLNTY